MNYDECFFNPRLNFQVLNVGLTNKQICSAIPADFSESLFFIQFYQTYNGLYFPDGALIRTNGLDENNGKYHKLEVEYIYSVEHLVEMWNSTKENSAEVKKYMEKHFAFARDASGNEFVIEIPSGVVKYISWEYKLERVLNTAKNFREFCRTIEPLDLD